MNFLEIKHLRMVRAIAETGNMTKAAGRLFVSQSALSQQLKDIEEKLRIDLFFRTRKKMVLTPGGQQLLQSAEKIVGLLEETELEIAKLAAGERGELKVGTQCIFCFKWLPQLLRNFQVEFPNVAFEIGTSSDPGRELHEKRFDIVITGRPLPANDYENQPLFQDQLVCIMAGDHPLQGQSFVRLEDFQEENLISHAELAESKFYHLLLKPKGIEPKKFMTVGQPQAIVELVAAGIGVGIFPRWALTSALRNNMFTARPITRRGLPLTWSAVFLKNANMPVYQKEFVNMVKRMNIAGRPREFFQHLRASP